MYNQVLVFHISKQWIFIFFSENCRAGPPDGEGQGHQAQDVPQIHGRALSSVAKSAKINFLWKNLRKTKQNFCRQKCNCLHCAMWGRLLCTICSWQCAKRMQKNITNPICVYYHIICVVEGVSYKTASLYKVHSFYDPITGALCILCKPSSE